LRIFAKGNLDVRDTLHSLRVGGAVQWNGINELVRERFPGTVVQVIHETATRSDALLAATGTVPAVLSGRSLPLGPYPLAAQFSTALFGSRADAIVLSIQPEVANKLARHRRDGFLFYPHEPKDWPADQRAWLRDEFVPEGLLDVDASMRNLEAVVARVRTNTAAPILVFNLSAAVPGDTVHCYQGLPDTLATRIRRFNVALTALSQRTGLSIVDVDAVVARVGAAQAKLDALHLTPEGCRHVAAETVRVLDDLAFFAAKEPA
jgi:hypothetical protein